MEFNVMFADAPNEYGEVYSRETLEGAITGARARSNIYNVNVPLLMNEATALEVYDGISLSNIAGTCKKIYFDKAENCVKADIEFAGKNGDILKEMKNSNVSFGVSTTMVDGNIHSFYVNPTKQQNSKFVSSFDDALEEEF